MHEVISNLIATINHLPKNRPVVIFANSVPFFLQGGTAKDIDELIEFLIIASSDRNILMPAFTKGFSNNFIDLDSEPSSNGYISQLFLEKTGFSRSLSAFFSFTVIGPSVRDLTQLKPIAVWGEGSLYRWLTDHKAINVTLGLEPYVSSLTHVAEYIEKDYIFYREDVIREGRIKLREKVYDLTETLFACKEGYLVDFKPILSHEKSSPQVFQNSKVPMAIWDSSQMVHIARQMICSNPSVFLKQQTKV